MLLETPIRGQRFFVPEVVQTSAMDCGPAALKAILEGFGVPVSYGRLREACQTDVDGTSINTIEDIAVQLGLQAEQIMVPLEHLLLPEAQTLPAIVVVRLPSGMTHFLVVWNRVGNLLQVMDPATGRRWPSWQKFLNEVYVHTFPVAAQAWREWATTQGFLAPLKRRLADLRIEENLSEGLIRSALADAGWRSLATLDAAVRMVTAIVRAKGLLPGEDAGKVLERFYDLNRRVGPRPLEAASGERADSAPMIPIPYWSVLPLEAREHKTEREDHPEQLALRGAVLVRVSGRMETVERELGGEVEDGGAIPLPADLEAALKESPYRPEREILRALKEDGLLTPVILGLALLTATLGVMVEALLFQGILQVGQSLTQSFQRVAAIVVLLVFVFAPLLLEIPISSTILRMGRRLESRLRIAFLEKIPRLGDRYFHSRLTSDMTQRAHDLRSLRMLPGVGISLLRTGFQLILTSLGVIWLDVQSAPLAILGTLFFIGYSLLSRPVIEERDLRLRTHIGALSRFYLDALLGLVPARSHSAERAIRRQHESHMVEWVRSGRDFYTLSTYIQTGGTLLYSVFAILIVMNYISRGGHAHEILLLFYWTLSLPTLGQALADQIQQYPMLRNRVLRMLEPLGAPDEEEMWYPDKDKTAFPDHPVTPVNPAGIQMQGVEVQVGGHTILQDIHLEVQPGEHIAIVGPSGAGKTSLVGLLLGWHRPSRGRIEVDGVHLDGSRLQTLRREIAWVDPAIQIWNRTLFENLRYGLEHEDAAPIGEAIQSADLFDVLDRLPEGLKTTLGEGGGLVSGGEGQRVRLGRAMLRPAARLVVLDEPFRGLDRDARRRLLVKAKQHWSSATLLCITHDVSETLSFERVLVIEDGHIVEDGAPGALAAQAGSRYRSMLDGEEAVRAGLWKSSEWRRVNLEDGRLHAEQNPGLEES